jgi:hypothetical protein
MADGGAETDTTVTEPPLAEESLRGLFQRLLANAKELGTAEVARWRAVAMRRTADARWALVLAAISLFIVQAAVTAMAVGILLVLALPLGFGWATVIVTVGGLAIAAILVRIAIGIVRGAFAKEE